MLDKIWPVHQDLIGQDPRFYVRLAAWYADHGDVRDHKEMFIVNLALSDFPGHRDVGLAMLRALPPYQVVRVVDFIAGRKSTRKMRKGEEKKALAQASKAARQGIARRLFGSAKAPETEESKAVAAPSMITEEFGLFRNVPRAMKTEITRYLREREADPHWFDGSVLTARKAMKRLYALLHVRPGERYVIAANHQSTLDILALLVVLQGRTPMRFLAKRALFHVPVLGWGMRLYGHTPVDRRRARGAVADLGEARRNVMQRWSTMFFPEGTRSATGRLLPFRLGAFRTASAAGVRVLPVTIDGAGALQSLIEKIGDWEVIEDSVELNQLVPTRGVAHAPISLSA